MLIKARSMRLDREEKERQTKMFVHEEFDASEKFPFIEEAFNASDQPVIQKIFEDIIHVGRAVKDGKVTCVRKRATHYIRKLNYKMRLAEQRKQAAEAAAEEEEEEERDDDEEEEEHQASLETDESGRHLAIISLQQYRRTLVLAICCKNARRAQEIFKYSVDEYMRDVEK